MSSGSKRAVIYLRVSTNDQVKTDYDADGFSIRAQREACERKASELDAVVVEEFVDRGESAKSADRAELQRMLASLRAAGGIDFVIVHKVDRLARSREDDMAIVIAIRKAGAQLVSATENIDETPQGKLLHGIMATIAEFYSANLATEAKKGMHQKVLSGGTPYLAPLGYLNTRERIEAGKEIRVVTVDPDRAHHIQWVFESYASGAWSMGELAKALNDRGFRTRGRAGKGTLVHKTHVDGILKNPYYIGIVTYDGIEYPGRHQPLIDPEVFEQVQSIRESRAKAREKIHKHPHYLKGSLTCGRCGDRLGVMNATGNGGRYPYFYCLGRARRRTECTFKTVLIETVEQKVELLWQSIHLPEDRIQEINSEATSQLERVYAQGQQELARQQRRSRDLERQQAKAKEAYYSDAMSLDEFRSEQRRIANEKRTVDVTVSRCQMEIEELRLAVAEALGLLADAHQLYLAASSSIRRQLNQAVFSKFRVGDGGDVRADLAAPFRQLVDRQGMSAEQTTESEQDPADEVAATAAEPNTSQAPGALDDLFVRQVHLAADGEEQNRAPSWERGSNYGYMVGDTGFEPVTSSVSRKRAPTAPIALKGLAVLHLRGGDGI